MTSESRKGFTLIELLIVVAIIAILAAIAVPNFLEAQTRSKVSRAKTDLRSLSVGFGAYHVDQNQWPLCNTIVRDAGAAGINNPDVVFMKQTILSNGDRVYDGYWPTQATTPVAYLTSLPKDPFPTRNWDSSGLASGPFPLQNQGAKRNYFVWVFPDGRESRKLEIGRVGLIQADVQYYLVSPGPDQGMTLGIEWEDEGMWANATYDPTNGTISPGNIVRFGP